MEKEFDEMFDKIVKANAAIPCRAIITILGGLVNNTDSDSKEMKDFTELVKDMPVKDVINKTVLFTCNSIIVNIWNMFGDQIEKLIEDAEAAENEKLSIEEVKEDNA